MREHAGAVNRGDALAMSKPHRNARAAPLDVGHTRLYEPAGHGTVPERAADRDGLGRHGLSHVGLSHVGLSLTEQP